MHNKPIYLHALSLQSSTLTQYSWLAKLNNVVCSPGVDFALQHVTPANWTPHGKCSCVLQGKNRGLTALIILHKAPRQKLLEWRFYQCKFFLHDSGSITLFRKRSVRCWQRFRAAGQRGKAACQYGLSLEQTLQVIKLMPGCWNVGGFTGQETHSTALASPDQPSPAAHKPSFGNCFLRHVPPINAARLIRPRLGCLIVSYW